MIILDLIVNIIATLSVVVGAMLGVYGIVRLALAHHELERDGDE